MFPFSTFSLIAQLGSFTWMQSLNLQLCENFRKSGNIFSKSFLFFNFGNSIVENPGVSIINVLSSILKNLLSVVVWRPREVLLLTSFVSKISSPSKLLIREDFPEPLGPEIVIDFPWI